MCRNKKAEKEKRDSPVREKRVDRLKLRVANKKLRRRKETRRFEKKRDGSQPKWRLAPFLIVFGWRAAARQTPNLRENGTAASPELRLAFKSKIQSKRALELS